MELIDDSIEKGCILLERISSSSKNSNLLVWELYSRPNCLCEGIIFSRFKHLMILEHLIVEMSTQTRWTAWREGYFHPFLLQETEIIFIRYRRLTNYHLLNALTLFLCWLSLCLSLYLRLLRYFFLFLSWCRIDFLWWFLKIFYALSTSFQWCLRRLFLKRLLRTSIWRSAKSWWWIVAKSTTASSSHFHTFRIESKLFLQLWDESPFSLLFCGPILAQFFCQPSTVGPHLSHYLRE